MRSAAHLALAPLLALLSVQDNQDTPVFKATVDAVTMDVYVHRNGRSVSGLKAEDFIVYDNGVQQDIDLIEAKNVPLSAILLFDASESVQGPKLEQLRKAGLAFLDDLDDLDQAALLTFNVVMELGSPPTPDLESVRADVARIEPQGGTALKDALFGALKITEGLDRPIILLFTDGKDILSWLTEEEILKAVRESNAVVYAVSTLRQSSTDSARTLDAMSGIGPFRAKTGVATASNEAEFLNSIAAISGGAFLTVNSPSRLEKNFVSILKEMKTRYLLTYYPQGEREEGWHDVRIQLKTRRAEIRARQGYYYTPEQSAGK
jgi:VWFA-related protein